MLKSRLIFDVTQLLHWPGRLTGIPRVMQELATRFVKEKNIEFVVWDTHGNHFRTVDLMASLAERGRRIVYQGAGEKQSVLAKKPRPSVGMVVKKAGTKTVHFLEARNIRGVRKIANALLDVQAKQHNGFLFEPSDTLFIPWGEMHDERFIKKLQELKSQDIRLAQIIHDLLPIITPQFSGHSTASMTNYMTQIAPICDLIIAVSENTKKDTARWLKAQDLTVPPIKVMRNGDDFEFTKPKVPHEESFKESGLKSGDFFVCVGTLEARKNHALLYYAYKLAVSKSITLPKLVVVGRRGWKTDDIYEMMTTDPEVKDQFVFLHNAGDDELAWLYKNAYASIYPSFYEGWGIPIAESLAYGTPCIASNASCLPEVAGNLINYFDPASSEECLQEITGLLDSKVYKKQQAKAKKYKTSSWDTSFSQVNEYIRSIHD